MPSAESVQNTLEVVQTIVMVVVFVIAALLRWGASGGVLLKRLVDLEQWRERVGQRQSDLADQIQPLVELPAKMAEDHHRLRELIEHVNVLPHRLQDDFITRREAAHQVTESKEDRGRLWAEVERLRTTVERLTGAGPR